MREIKFRAWDKEHNFFIYATLFNRVETPFEATNFPPKGKEWSLKAPKELIWEQYTGLKDKNGLDSFEDDMIKYKEKYFIIKFYLGCYYACGEEEKHLLSKVINHSESAGNIWEDQKEAKTRNLIE